MTRRLILTPEASDDLIQIEAWLEQPGAGAAARTRLRRLVAALDDLLVHPRRGRAAGASGERATAASGFRIVYNFVETPEGDAVLILRIFGPGQDFPNARQF